MSSSSSGGPPTTTVAARTRVRVLRREGEDVRPPAAPADRVDGVEPEVVEKLRGVVRDRRDAPAGHSRRRAVAGPVEDDDPDVEPIVRVLVGDVANTSIRACPGSAGPADRPAGRTRCQASVRPSRSVSAPVAHDAKLWR